MTTETRSSACSARGSRCLEELLLAGRDPSLVFPAAIDGHPWLVVDLDGAVHVVTFKSPTDAELHFLGSFAGGNYCELLTFEKADDQTVELRFVHPKLPGPLIVRSERYHQRPDFHRLRERFRAAALLPSD